jgi:hypothetical protein
MWTVISSKTDNTEVKKSVQNKVPVLWWEILDIKTTISEATEEIQWKILAVKDFWRFNNVVKVILWLWIENPAEEITKLTQIREADDYNWKNTWT